VGFIYVSTELFKTRKLATPGHVAGFAAVVKCHSRMAVGHGGLGVATKHMPFILHSWDVCAFVGRLMEAKILNIQVLQQVWPSTGLGAQLVPTSL
jgi:hypothetical protein